MPKRDIAELQPGTVIAIDEPAPLPPYVWANPPPVQRAERVVYSVEDLRGGATTARWRITFMDGDSVTFDHDRCWVVRERDPSFRLPPEQEPPPR